MKEKLISLFLFIGSFAFYLFQAAPSVTAGDSGEFITAAATLSLPHAPSFPLYVLLGRCFIEVIPFASIAFRVNVFSALTSAAALVFCYRIGRNLGASVFLSLIISLLIGTSASFWANSLVAEVFSLNVFLTSFLLWCLVKMVVSSDPQSSSRYLALFSFVLGLGMGNHHILVFLLGGAGLIIALRFNNWNLRYFVMAVLFGLIGFSIYMTLPVRSAKEPPLNWGQPTNIQKLARTITRKDYGSLRLALGESPQRNFHNTARHIKEFSKQMRQETSLLLTLFSLAGLCVGFWRRQRFAWVLLTLFVLSGPFFYVLGNLPFNAQSAGIIGRFFIMPVLFLSLGLVFLDRRIIFILPLFLILNVRAGYAHGYQHRNSTLVLDYGRSMLRSMPPQSVLFMDGGDDAFYSLAMLRYVMNKRPDVEMHDRGGLVFKNVYGDDFRTLSKNEKTQRRREIEESYLRGRPVFYSTMDTDALPGVFLVLKGFLYEAGGSAEEGIQWPVLCLRSLYPHRPDDYRTRALAAFFPFIEGKRELARNDFEKALRFFNRAQLIGHDVDWLKINLGVEYSKWGYESLMRGRLALSEWIYKQWISFDPSSIQAQSNLGVTLERAGKIEEARLQYKKASELFPEAVDPVFNLAVLAWKDGHWLEVVRNLEEVLRRQPTHPQARGYLEQAKQKMKEKSL